MQQKVECLVHVIVVQFVGSIVRWTCTAVSANDPSYARISVVNQIASPANDS